MGFPICHFLLMMFSSLSFFLFVLEIEPRTSLTLGNHCMVEPHPSPVDDFLTSLSARSEDDGSKCFLLKCSSWLPSSPAVFCDLGCTHTVVTHEAMTQQTAVCVLGLPLFGTRSWHSPCCVTLALTSLTLVKKCHLPQFFLQKPSPTLTRVSQGAS